MDKDLCCQQGFSVWWGSMCALSKDFKSTIRTCALFLERICALSKDFVVFLALSKDFDFRDGFVSQGLVL